MGCSSCCSAEQREHASSKTGEERSDTTRAHAKNSRQRWPNKVESNGELVVQMRPGPLSLHKALWRNQVAHHTRDRYLLDIR